MSRLDYQSPLRQVGTSWWVFWSRFVGTATAGIVVEVVIDTPLHRLAFGIAGDGGTILVGLLGVPVTAIGLVLLRFTMGNVRMNEWVAILTGGGAAPVALILTYLIALLRR